jgi:hypothetical protein
METGDEQGDDVAPTVATEISRSARSVSPRAEMMLAVG